MDLQSLERSDENRSRVQLTRDQKRALPIIFMISICGVAGATIVPPAIPTIATHFQIAKSTAALLLTANPLPGIILAPVAGVLADRLGRKQILIPCVVIFGMAGGLGALAPSFYSLMAFRLLQGVGSAGMINLAVVMIGDLFDDEHHRTRIMGYNAGFLTLGTTSFPLIGGLLAGIDWRWVFAFFWLALPLGMAAFFMLPDKRITEEERERVKQSGTFSSLQIPTVRRLVIRGGVIFIIIFGAILTAGPIMLSERIHARPTTIGLALTAAAFCSMLAAVNTGRIRDRFHPAKSLFLAALLYVTGLAILTAANTYSIAVIGFMLSGFADGLSIPLLQTRATEVAPPGRRGTVVALWVSSARIGQTSGPILAKIGIDFTGITATMASFTTVAMALAIGSGIRVAKTGDEDAGAPLEEVTVTPERSRPIHRS